MSVLRAIAVDDIFARGSIKDTDVAKFRRAFDDDGVISPLEAETLFDLHVSCPVQDGSWSSCFVDMLTDYVVDQMDPDGYITLDNADWLLHHIASDGRIESKTEFELLVSVIDKSRWTPERLVCVALEQVKFAIADGTGPLRVGRTVERGAVQDSDVELIRRILYAFGGDGSVAISRAEAEILLAIDAATAGADNAEGWRDLFVKAIANCMMAASGHAVPTREAALAPSSNRALTGYSELSTEGRAIARLERHKIEIITCEPVSQVEPQWLAARLGRDGRSTPNETALAAMITAESPKIDPQLQLLVTRLAKAA